MVIPTAIIVSGEVVAARERFKIEVIDHALRFHADRQGFERAEILLYLLLTDSFSPIVRDEDGVRYLEGPNLGDNGIIDRESAQDCPTTRGVLCRVAGEAP
jgi:hypothetical protein